MQSCTHVGFCVTCMRLKGRGLHEACGDLQIFCPKALPSSTRLRKRMAAHACMRQERLLCISACACSDTQGAAVA